MQVVLILRRCRMPVKPRLNKHISMNNWFRFQITRRSAARLLLALCFGPVFAGDRGESKDHSNAGMRHSMKMESGATYLSLDEVVDRIRSQTAGRILSAEKTDSGYRIRVLTGDGKVRRFRIDSSTGRAIKRHR